MCQRNVTVFADGAVDRSSCGSGTSARLAHLFDRGQLGIDDELPHRSIIGTEFPGRITGLVRSAGLIPQRLTAAHVHRACAVPQLVRLTWGLAWAVMPRATPHLVFVRLIGWLVLAAQSEALERSDFRRKRERNGTARPSA